MAESLRERGKQGYARRLSAERDITPEAAAKDKLKEFVDGVIVTDELGGPQFRKPCDIAFRIMQRRWGVPFAQMAYVGDNPAKDFHAPHQLGMASVWLKGDGLYAGVAERSATWEVESLSQVLDLPI